MDNSFSMPADPLGPGFPVIDWIPIITWLRDLQKAGATLEEAAAFMAAMIVANSRKHEDDET
jgi:hypothetical protein